MDSDRTVLRFEFLIKREAAPVAFFKVKHFERWDAISTHMESLSVDRDDALCCELVAEELENFCERMRAGSVYMKRMEDSLAWEL